MSLRILGDEFNKLLQRRELVCTFKSSAGLITRQDAVKSLAKKIRADPKNVYLVRISGQSGSRDVVGRFYVYKNDEDAKKQLPKYLFLRLLPRDERKKLLEEQRKAKPVESAKKE